MTGDREIRVVLDQSVTREQLAEMLEVSTDTVDRWRAAGMPWHHWGRRLVRFRVREVTRWLDDQDRKAA